MTNSHEHWLELRGGLMSLLEALAPLLDADTQELVRDFVDNREFGVALEWLHSAVLRKKVTLTPNQAQKVQRIGELHEDRLGSQVAQDGVSTCGTHRISIAVRRNRGHHPIDRLNSRQA